MIVMLIVVEALRTISEDLEKILGELNIGERTKTIQNTALLRPHKIL